MREYELFYLVGESKEAEIDAIRSEVEKMVKEEGAEFLAPETSDKRKLAYEVKDETRGLYIARRFTLPDKTELSHEEFDTLVEKGDPLSRLQRKISLSKNILRALILRADALPELKAIERTEYATKRETAPNRNRSTTRPAAAPRPVADTPAPDANKDKDAKPVSKEQIDKQLEEVLNI